MDYTNKDIPTFIEQAKTKIFGKKETNAPPNRQCLQETIANAFLDENSARRFVTIFNAFARSQNPDTAEQEDSSDSDSISETSSSSSPSTSSDSKPP